MKDLSIIIISYNTLTITRQCLKALTDCLTNSQRLKTEIILVDNGSTDGSLEMLEQEKEKIIKKNDLSLDIKLIKNDGNKGFAKANNDAFSHSSGKYVLFLNSDAIIKKLVLSDLVYYMDKNPEVGVITIKVTLPDGQLDLASHRGYPSLWRSFTYFSKLEYLFKHIPKLTKLFGGYHLLHLDLNTIHEVDSVSGAFYFTRANILKKTGGFDTKFFMYGEDLDLSHRIKKLGYKIIFYPLYEVIHLKYKSGLKKRSQKRVRVTKNYFYDAMKIFYDKHQAKGNGKIKNKLVHFFINLKKRLS